MHRFAPACFALVCLLAPTLQAEEKVDYIKDVKPILEQHCYRCHGEQKGSGDLRLHTVALLKEILADEYVLVSGKPDDSELIARIILPADDELLMPKGSKPLPEASIEVLKNWIEAGADLPDEDPTEPKSMAEILPEVDEASPEAIAKLEEAGAQVLPLFSGSNLLRVSFAFADEKASDSSVMLLSDIAPQVYALDLSRSEVTDAGLAVLAQLTNLSQLHLELTSVGDPAIQYLAGLQQLEYLNLYSTKVTDAAMAHLEGLPKLKKLYVWQTEVSYAKAMAMQEAREGLEVNLGWNHPEVAKVRLTKELERVTSSLDEATRQEEAAKKAKAAAAERKTQIEAELAELNPKSEEEEASAETGGQEETDSEKPAEEAKKQ